MFNVTFVHTNPRGCVPYSYCVEEKKMVGSSRVHTTLNSVVLIAGHIDIALDWDHRGSHLKLATEVYYAKPMGIK